MRLRMNGVCEATRRAVGRHVRGQRGVGAWGAQGDAQQPREARVEVGKAGGRRDGPGLERQLGAWWGEASSPPLSVHSEATGSESRA